MIPLQARNAAVPLGAQLRTVRLAAKLSQRRLASLAAVDIDTLAGIEAGRGLIQSFLVLLEQLGASLDGLQEPRGIGHWVAEHRRRRGLSQVAAAALADLSKPTIIAVERGQGQVRSLETLLRAYGVPAVVIQCGLLARRSGARRTARHEVIHGDALEVLRGQSSDTTSAVVTDPPYGLSALTPAQATEIVSAWAGGRDFDFHSTQNYMGKEWKHGSSRSGSAVHWDNDLSQPSLWRETLRILRPGGHALVFAAPRNADLVGIALRLGGFEIRDTHVWVYKTGFRIGRNVGDTLAKRVVREQRHVDDGITIPTTRRRFPGHGAQVAAREGAALSRDELIRLAGHPQEPGRLVCFMIHLPCLDLGACRWSSGPFLGCRSIWSA